MTKINVLLWYWGRRGGGTKYSLEVANVLMKEDNIVLYLSLSRQSILFEDFMSLNLPGFHVNTYMDKLSAIKAIPRLPNIRANFYRYLVDNEIDIVYCPMHHIWNILMFSAIRKAKAKYVFTLHDAFPKLGKKQSIASKLITWLFKKDIKEANYIITLSQFVKKQLIQTYQFDNKRCCVIPHGVFDYSNDSYKKARNFPKNKCINLLFFGRIVYYKGINLLLDSFSILKQEFPEIRLKIAGSGDISPYHDKLTNISGIEVDNRVLLEEEIGELFAKADILVAPYTQASQSGVIAIAMGSALPVVATPVGGLKEQVVHEHNGLLAEELTALALSSAIRKLITSPELYEKCSLGAISEVSESINWSTVGQKISSKIEKVVRNH